MLLSRYLPLLLVLTCWGCVHDFPEDPDWLVAGGGDGGEGCGGYGTATISGTIHKSKICATGLCTGTLVVAALSYKDDLWYKQTKALRARVCDAQLGHKYTEQYTLRVPKGTWWVAAFLYRKNNCSEPCTLTMRHNDWYCDQVKVEVADGEKKTLDLWLDTNVDF